jgi:hypothetical protein
LRVFSCFGHILVFGTALAICFAGGMASYLYERNFRILDYLRFRKRIWGQQRMDAEKLVGVRRDKPAWS